MTVGSHALCSSIVRTALVAALASAGMVVSVAHAQDSASAVAALPQAPPGLERVGVDEHLGASLPLDAMFRDHTGRRVRLGDVISGERPVLLTLVYHSCPSFCSLVLDGTVGALAQQAWTVGREIDAVTISIDPRDTPAIAADRRRRILARYGRPEAERGWHFLVAERSVGDHENVAAFGVYPAIERVARAVGFRYEWMPRQRQYAHPGVIMALTPRARVARYLYGLEFASQDLRLALLEAAEGRSTSSLEHVLLYCYRYDASAQGYTIAAWRVMQLGGALTALALLAFLFVMWRGERQRIGPAVARAVTSPPAVRDASLSPSSTDTSLSREAPVRS